MATSFETSTPQMASSPTPSNPVPTSSMQTSPAGASEVTTSAMQEEASSSGQPAGPSAAGDRTKWGSGSSSKNASAGTRTSSSRSGGGGLRGSGVSQGASQPSHALASREKGERPSATNVKNRGDSSPRLSRATYGGGGGLTSSYQPQQSNQASANSLIHPGGLAYPYLYPSPFHMAGFPASTSPYTYGAAPTQNSSSARASSSRDCRGSGEGAGSQGGLGNSSAGGAGGGTNSRRAGKKKAPTAQVTNPEYRLFFSLRRRDSSVSSNKGQQHIYKPKNPPTLMEWFKKLSVEERVNALSTVCPHLTELLMNMYQRLEQNGITLFARQGSQQQQDNQFHQSYHPHSLAAQAYPPYGHLFTHQDMGVGPQSSGGQFSFKDLFYTRNCVEGEKTDLMTSERGRIGAEQEILRYIRLTDYYQSLDTLTIQSEIVQEPEFFFRLMQIATNNQAFSRESHFEMKPAGYLTGGYVLQMTTPVIEQPAWFKPRSFHTFATWVLVALEENLWAHYNIDNNIYSPGQGVKTSDLAALFREKTDCCVLDVDSSLLASYWKEQGDKEKRPQIEQFKQQVFKEFGDVESQAGGGSSSIRSHQKVAQSKGISYTLQIKEKSEKQSPPAEINDTFLKALIDMALKPNSEERFIQDLIYSSFECSGSSRQVGISRKFLDLIKRKYKDDLMDNLLQEEQTKGGSGQGPKATKKKKKKASAAVIKSGELASSTISPAPKTLPAEEKHPVTNESTKSTQKKAKIASNPVSSVSTNQSTPKQVVGKVAKKKKSKKSVKNEEGTVQEDKESTEETVQNNEEAKADANSTEPEQVSIDPKTEKEDSAECSKVGENNEGDLKQGPVEDLKLESDLIMATNPVSQLHPVIETPETLGAQVKTTSDAKHHSTPQKKQSKHEPQSDSGGPHKKERYQIKSASSSNSNSVVNKSCHHSSGSRGGGSRGHSLEEREELRLYLVELANMMINEVCRRAETASHSPQRVVVRNSDQLPKEAFDQLGGIAKNAEETKQPSRKSSTTIEATAVPRKYSSSDPGTKQTIPQQRRGFGINLKSSNTSTDDNLHLGGKGKPAVTAKKPPQHQQPRKQTSESIEEQIVRRQSNVQEPLPASRVASAKPISQEPREQVATKAAAKAESKPDGKVVESDLDSSTIIKKKRNKKKPAKMSDTDIMNQFMKSLHSNPEEEKSSGQQRKKQQANGAQSNHLSNDSAKATQPRSQQARNAHEQATSYQGGNRRVPLEKVTSEVAEHAKPEAKQAKQEGKTEETEQVSTPNTQDRTKMRASFPQGASRNAEEEGQQRQIHENQKKIQAISRKYTEEQLISSHPLTHHITGQSFAPNTLSNDQDCSTSHDGVKQRVNAKRNNAGGMPKNAPIKAKGIGAKVQHKPIIEIQPHKAPVEINSEESKSEVVPIVLQTNLNLSSAPFKVSIPFNTITIPTTKTPVLEGDMLLQEAITESEISLEAALSQQHPLHLVKHKSIQSTPAKVLSSTIQSGKSSRQNNVESVVHNFQNTSQDSSNYSAQDDSKGGSSKHPAYRTPPQNSKKHGQQNQYFTAHTHATADTPQMTQNATNIKRPQFNSSSAQSAHNQKQEFYPPFEPNFASNFIAQGTGLQSTFGGVPYHPYQAQPPPFIGEAEAQPQQSTMPLQSPVFVPTPSMTPPLQFSNSTPAFHPAQGKRTHYQGNSGMQKQFVGRSQNSNNSRQHWTTNGGPSSARNLNNSSSSSHGSNVYLQPMNISQSMQEQQQQLMNNFMVNNSTQNASNGENIFLQDQHAFLQPYNDMSQRQQSQEQVFPYIEKTQSFNHGYLGSPLPCFSPQQNYGYLSTQHQHLGMPSQQDTQSQMAQQSLYNYQRNHSMMSPAAFAQGPIANGMQAPGQMVNPQFDQSQDLIFQIFNSIKSNHSMSPIPQAMSPPQMMLDYQISQQPDFHHTPTPESHFYDKLDQDILSYCQQVADTLNQLKPERDFVIQRIQEIANRCFVGEHPRLELFGSLVTGLALESSDMDLAVTGLRIEDRYQMITDLKNLATSLEEWKVLEGLKAIETASIPVIKMKVDLSLLREKEMSEREPGDFLRRPIPQDQRFLSVDITFDDTTIQTYSQSFPSSPNMMMSPSELTGMFETKTHLGLQSCALVQRYLSEYKHLKEVAILMKKFLAFHNFNSPYYGGLSSYSTVIIIVAYMNYYGLKSSSNQLMVNQFGQPYYPGSYHANHQAIDELSPSRLLMGFLDFYANFFNPANTGISVVDDGSFFQVHNMMSDSANFMILDPLNLANNTTKNSYLTRQILQMFQASFNNLKSLMYKLYNPHAMTGPQVASPNPPSPFHSSDKEPVPQPAFKQSSASPSKKSQIDLSASQVANDGAVSEQRGRNTNDSVQKSRDSLIVANGEVSLASDEKQKVSYEAVVSPGKGAESASSIGDFRQDDKFAPEEEQKSNTSPSGDAQLVQPSPNQLTQQDTPTPQDSRTALVPKVSLLDVFFSKDGLLPDSVVAQLLVTHVYTPPIVQECQREEPQSMKQTENIESPSSIEQSGSTLALV